MTNPIQRQPPAPPAAQAGSISARARMAAGAPYLAGLNAEQRQAVEALDGPVLVLAGAGTGKTRVLTTRIAHLLSLGRARPGEILAVTFTNKAAREMKNRVGEMVGQIIEGMPWLGTFHAVGAKILRRHAELVGLKPDFTILDVDDQIRLIKQQLAAENIDEKRWPARVLAGQIDNWKNRGLTVAQVPAGEGAAFAGRGVALYKAYQERLKILNAADFGDLLLENIRLLREHPAIALQYQARLRFMLVDEYQDTNTAQYLWLRLLAQRGGDAGDAPRNICCVGDDDQSIYGWRGADVDNILRFEHDFPGAQVVRLERNYRSTGHILAAASRLIAHNQGRLGKTLRTQGEDGEKVAVTSAWDSEEEARAIGEEIEQLQRDGHDLDEMAILVRASFQMREFEDRFVTLGLNYRVIGGPRFYERAEIRDALAYLRLVNQPADDLAFERIVNVPKRGLGDATLKALNAHARAHGVSLMQATRAVVETDALKPRPRAALREVVAAFARWRARGETTAHAELAEIVLEESGYIDMWRNDRSADAAGRLDNLKEFVRSMEEFENLQGFLEHVSLVMDTDGGADAQAVSIMTLHAAKGLEFDTVFLPGWEEGLLPHQRSLDDSGRAGLEEERRLAHVGITRARRRAKIYFVANRRMHGSWTSALPSRFIDELPPEAIDVGATRGEFGGLGARPGRFERMDGFASNYGTPGWRRAQQHGRGAFSNATDDPEDAEAARIARPARLTVPAGASAPFARDGLRRAALTIDGELVAKSTGPSAFSAGDRVFHQKFGNGNVTAVDGNKLTIQFDRAGEKRVVDSFVARA